MENHFFALNQLQHYSQEKTVKYKVISITSKMEVAEKKQVEDKSKHQNTVTHVNSDTAVSPELQQSAKILAHVNHQNHIYLSKIIPCFFFKRFIVSISTEVRPGN